MQGSALCAWSLSPLLSHGSGLRGSFSLELPIGPELAPRAKVLGYVVLPDSEMVADSTELKVDKCFPNKVSRSCQSQGSCCWAWWRDVGIEPRSSAEPFLIPCSCLVPDSPFREGFPSSPILVAAANHLLVLITVLTPDPPLEFGVGLWHRVLPGSSSPLP